MSRRKLLLADDSVTIQKVVNLTFADEGIDVVAVGDGDSAMQSIVSDLPDIVLADVHMPGVNGYQICELLRENEATRRIPVILLVGSFEPFDEAEAQRVGASAYLTKPFTSIRQLVAKVTDLMAPVSAQTPVATEPETVPFAETVSDLPIAEEATFEPAYSASAEPGTTEDDIDRLYEASMAPPSEQTSELADIGVDDDIIETSYTDENIVGDIADFEIVSRAGDPTAGEFPSVDLPEPQLESIFDSPVAEEASALSASDWSSDSATEPLPVPFIEEEIEQPPAAVPFEEPRSSFDPQMEEYFEESNVEQGDSSGTVDFAVEYAVSEPASPFHAPVVDEDTIRMDERFDNTSSPDFLFDDVDLLDIPADVPVEVTTPAIAAVERKVERLVTLSPELIETIAQRVVEKLSEKYQ